MFVKHLHVQQCSINQKDRSSGCQTLKYGWFWDARLRPTEISSWGCPLPLPTPRLPRPKKTNLPTRQSTECPIWFTSLPSQSRRSICQTVSPGSTSSQQGGRKPERRLQSDDGEEAPSLEVLEPQNSFTHCT